MSKLKNVVNQINEFKNNLNRESAIQIYNLVKSNLNLIEFEFDPESIEGNYSIEYLEDKLEFFEMYLLQTTFDTNQLIIYSTLFIDMIKKSRYY